MFRKLFKLTNRFGRRGTIDKALELFHERDGKLIVEIGSIRDATPTAKITDGYSTVAWALHAERVISVDIEPYATVLTKILTKEYGNVEAITCDGVKFLEEFQEPIDLLYLDAWDGHLADCKSKHLEAYRVARKNFHENTLILIDDAHVKAKFVVPEALKNGFKVVFEEYQVLLSK